MSENNQQPGTGQPENGSNVIVSIAQLRRVAKIEVEKVEIKGLGFFYFRGLTENEVQRLTKLGGKMRVYEDKTQEFDLSALSNGGDLNMFAMGWVTDETGTQNVIPYTRNKKAWQEQLDQLGNLPSKGFSAGAAAVRRLTGLDKDDEETKEDFLETTADS